MGIEIRVGRIDKPLSRDAVEVAHTYAENRDLINAVRAYADSNTLDRSMPNIPGLSDEAMDILRGPVGYGVVNTWAHLFGETFQHLDGYDRGGAFAPEDLEKVIQSQQSTIKALGSRATHHANFKNH